MIPPWKSDPARFPTPRDSYLAGTWNYAYGKPAKTHPDYKKALRKAKGFEWWVRSWSDVEAVLAGCYFDVDAGYDVVDFFSYLRHSKGRWGGERFELADWQIYDVVMPMFGWKRRDGTRRFRRGYVEIPKKNGKTTLSAGITLYLLMYDGEQGAEVYSAAVDREQAGMIYQAAAAMVKQSPELSKHLKCIDSRKRIIYQAANAFYMALSADVASKEGLNIHGAVFDELHVYPNSQMWDTLKYGGAARTQPLQFAITTAGIFDPTSLGWEQHDYALKIRDAISDAHKDWAQFVYVCGLSKDEAEHWDDPKLWEKANPSWGITIQHDEMAELCQVAQNVPTAQNDFKRYRLNIWTAQKSVWIPRVKWDACADDCDESDLEGRTCFAGMDLSLTQDITAVVLFFPRRDESEPHYMLPAFWCPDEMVYEHDEVYNGLYSLWRKSGHLLTTPGNIIDYEVVKCYTLSVKERFNLKSVCYDKWNATQLALDLQVEGLDMIPFGQGFAAMTEPTKRLADLIASKAICHNKNPVMDWMIGNAQAISDTNGNIRITKGEAQGPGKGKVRYKVDGVVAAIMAIGGWLIDESKPSVYERRGILTV